MECRSPALAAILVIACGSAPPADADDAFRRIQIEEAALARASVDADQCTEPCDARARVCEAVHAICAIADESRDPDARVRCQRAVRQCPEAL